LHGKSMTKMVVDIGIQLAGQRKISAGLILNVPATRHVSNLNAP
jgi:hypothetical protein